MDKSTLALSGPKQVNALKTNNLAKPRNRTVAISEHTATPPRFQASVLHGIFSILTVTQDPVRLNYEQFVIHLYDLNECILLHSLAPISAINYWILSCRLFFAHISFQSFCI